MSTLQNSHSSASFTNTVGLHTSKPGQQTTVTKSNCRTTAQKLYKVNPILDPAEAEQEDKFINLSVHRHHQELPSVEKPVTKPRYS